MVGEVAGEAGAPPDAGGDPRAASDGPAPKGRTCVTDGSPPAPERVDRRDGTTPAERYLGELCERTFLSVWSYSGLYRDQGKDPAHGVGKELTDLLVVFENDVIVFSDKHCAFPDTGKIDVDWPRWFRRSVLKDGFPIVATSSTAWGEQCRATGSCTVRRPRSSGTRTGDASDPLQEGRSGSPERRG